MGRQNGNPELTQAKRALAGSQGRRAQVDRVVGELQDQRRENHFAEAMRLAFEIRHDAKKADAE
jgi:hypothetical protein